MSFLNITVHLFYCILNWSICWNANNIFSNLVYDMWTMMPFCIQLLNIIVIPRTKYVRGILWFSRRYAAASAYHRLRDNLKKTLSDCFHILYVDWYRWEDSWEGRWARSDYFWATQGPPNSQKCTFLYIVAHMWKTGSYFFPLLYICLLYDKVLLPWNFRSPGFDVRAPQDPPNMKKKYIFFIFWV